jgi:hypothetical protein
MQHADLNRTGWYKQENSLTAKNVRPGYFGKLFERAVDDQVYAQPLLIYNVNVGSAGTKNLLIVATVNNTVYAFDADSANVPAPYWQVNLTGANSRPVNNTDMTGSCGGNYLDFNGNIGIVGTPVADTVTNTLYLVSRSLNVATNQFVQFIHALDISTGIEKFNGPQLITATVNGNGDGNVNGVITFDPLKQNQRGGLLLLNGIVYITWASHCDWGPYHGWVLGYDKSTLQQKIVYNTTPNGYFGGIWMSGAAPSADENGNIYVGIGNGSVGDSSGVSSVINRSESAAKLAISGNTLSVTTFFTPNNIEELEAADLDFGVTQMLLIPGTTRVLTGCKDGKLYMLDRDNMGGYNATANNAAQTIDLGLSAHLRSSLAYYQGQQSEYVYTWSENSLLKALPFDRTSGTVDLSKTISSGVQGPIGNNGAVLSVSSKGSVDSTAIVWASHAASGDANQSVRQGILHAFAANDVTKELWNSSMSASDDPGNYAKFNCPVIANGKVYLPTFSNKVVAYGILPNPATTPCNSPNIAINKTAIASSILNAATPASAAIDGDMTTAWSSIATDPQSLAVDLGSRYDICQVTINWGNATGKNFNIQLSDDSVHWKTIDSMTANTATQYISFVKATGRYVRVYATASNTSGYSINEFVINGAASANQCPEPSGLSASDTSENSVTLHWNGNGSGHFTVQYKTVSAVDWLSLPAQADSVVLTNLACGTDYFFRVSSLCNSTDSSIYSATVGFSTPSCSSLCGPLPTRWTTQDVGPVNAAGSACYNNGVYDLHGSGTDIEGTQDIFRYAYKTFAGDGELIARIVSIDNSDPWNKVGLMFRESLDPGSRNAFVALTSLNGIAFQTRVQTSGSTTTVNQGAGVIVQPYWLKLVKKGSVFQAFTAPDGKTWVQLGGDVDAGFGSGTAVYAGLALTSHFNGVVSVAKADNVTIGGEMQINLNSFAASLNLNKTVALQWVTTVESDIRNFLVERSNNETTGFAPIDSLQAVNGGSVTETYNAEDPNPGTGIKFYRLKIVTNDGSFSYSQVVAVRIDNSKAPLLFPNPVRHTLHIYQGEEPFKVISIFDVMGRRMGSVGNIEGNAQIDFPVSSYANGVYVVEIRTTGSVYRQKIVVNN